MRCGRVESRLKRIGRNARAGGMQSSAMQWTSGIPKESGETERVKRETESERVKERKSEREE